MGQISELLDKISRSSYFDHRSLPDEVQPLFEQRRKIAIELLSSEHSYKDCKSLYDMFDWCNDEIKKFFAL